MKPICLAVSVLLPTSFFVSCDDPGAQQEDDEVGIVLAPLTQLTVGQTLTSQRFEWKNKEAQRFTGKYSDYAVTLTAGTPYVFETSSPSGGNSANTYLYLLKANSSSASDIVAEDDDSAGGLQARISYTPSVTRTYYLRLRALAKGTFGFCTLSSSEAVTPSSGPIAAGDVLTNQVYAWLAPYPSRPFGTYGEYTLAVTAGYRYTIETRDLPSGADTFLYLLSQPSDDPAAILASDDDGAGGNASRIVYTATGDGTLTVRVRAYTQATSNRCTLAATAEVPPPPPPPAGTLAPGDTLPNQTFGWLSAYPNRWAGTYYEYNIFLLAGNRYTIETSNPTGGSQDTYLYLLDTVSDDAAAIVASDDDSGTGLASRILYIPAVSGTYYVRLRAYGINTTGATTLSATVQTPDPNATEVLPDLVTWAKPGSYMYDAYIQHSGGVKELRFSNAVANTGAGPMELFGVVETDGTTTAFQRVYTSDGFYDTRQVGVFVFDEHGDHNHWHFADFAKYSLRQVLVDDGVGDAVATSDKVTFCLMDVAQYDLGLPGAPAGGIYNCTNQGISVGWADVYGAGLSGQSIDVSNVPDGTYWLESMTDPSLRLFELSHDNNAARLRVSITGDTLAILP